jgi:hypothetical protein
MKSQIMGLKVAGTLFILVALAHLARLVLGWTVQLHGRYFGMRWSIAAIVVSAVLGIWLWMLAGCGKTDAASPPPPKA